MQRASAERGRADYKDKQKKAAAVRVASGNKEKRADSRSNSRSPRGEADSACGTRGSSTPAGTGPGFSAAGPGHPVPSWSFARTPTWKRRRRDSKAEHRRHHDEEL